MQSTILTQPTIQLIGITVRTSNQREQNPVSAQIGLTLQRYFSQGLALKIPHRKQPGTTFCVYTDYESDLYGDYTYFVGEAVVLFEHLPTDFVALTIPAQRYVKFTTASGIMPQIVIQAWQTIWNTTPEMLGGKRSYLADFEIYDERATDPQRSIVDLYIGLDAAKL